MLDASDALRVFADMILRSASGSPTTRFSNWVGHDLGGVIDLLDDANPARLIEYASSSAGLRAGQTLLDFGCGDGPHKDLLESRGLRWTGLDYDSSMDPTAVRRIGTDLDNRVVKYDGTVFPFENASFDAVWSFQSLEHVHSAEGTFEQIARVLKSGGTFFGSVSFLEAYHARSTFCYTPYGFKLLCDRYGLELDRLFPSIDGLSLIFRTYFLIMGMDESEYGDWTKMMKGGGVFFEALRRRAEATGQQHNLAEAMAQICGQFYFIVRKS